MKTTLHTEDIKIQMLVNEVEDFLADFARRGITSKGSAKVAADTVSSMIAAYHQDDDLYKCYKSIREWVEKVASREFAARTTRKQDAGYAIVQGTIYDMLEDYGL